MSDSESVRPSCSAFYWAWDMAALNVLIPKQRGTGWLKTPAGHHATPRTSAMEEAGGCDVCGLDGFLTFQCGGKIAVYSEKRRDFEARVLPAVTEWYKVAKGREVGLATLDDMRKQNASLEPLAREDG